jgi:sulfur-carrier protein
MEIEVRYFATFRKNNINKETMIFIDEATVGDVLKQAGIEEKELAILLVNGIKVNQTKKLSHGDIVSLFPPVGGG